MNIPDALTQGSHSRQDSQNSSMFCLTFSLKNMIFWISFQHWVCSCGFQSFFSTFLFSIKSTVPSFKVGSKTKSHYDSILTNGSWSSSYEMIIKLELVNKTIIKTEFLWDAVLSYAEGSTADFIGKNECREKRLETIWSYSVSNADSEYHAFQPKQPKNILEIWLSCSDIRSLYQCAWDIHERSAFSPWCFYTIL